MYAYYKLVVAIMATFQQIDKLIFCGQAKRARLELRRTDGTSTRQPRATSSTIDRYRDGPCTKISSSIIYFSVILEVLKILLLIM